MIEEYKSWFEKNSEQALSKLCAFLRFPSVSTDPAYKQELLACKDWLLHYMEEIGLEVEVWEGEGHPIIFGSSLEGGPKATTLLFYGHYDVQPVDPLTLWDHDPFAPFIEERAQGKVIRGRGASDDKGQLMTFVEACRAWIAENGTLPCTITFFFEG